MLMIMIPTAKISIKMEYDVHLMCAQKKNNIFQFYIYCLCRLCSMLCWRYWPAYFPIWRAQNDYVTAIGMV